MLFNLPFLHQYFVIVSQHWLSQVSFADLLFDCYGFTCFVLRTCFTYLHVWRYRNYFKHQVNFTYSDTSHQRVTRFCVENADFLFVPKPQPLRLRQQ